MQKQAAQVKVKSNDSENMCINVITVTKADSYSCSKILHSRLKAVDLYNVAA